VCWTISRVGGVMQSERGTTSDQPLLNLLLLTPKLSTMPPSQSLILDASLYLLLTSAFTLPLVTSLSSPSTSTRTQFRQLLHAATQAITIALGSVGVVVLGGAGLVVGEKVWRWANRKWEAFKGQTQRRRDE